MKVVILAGGFGTRITEESQYKPKPMIEIGGIPILVHIMEYYASFGHKDFIICAGYKQEKIKEYFLNSDVYDAKAVQYYNGRVMPRGTSAHSDWNVTVVDTGVGTLTGGRLKKIEEYLNPNEPFFMTYGDGLSNVDLDELLDFHYTHQMEGAVTMTGIKPDSRYGVLDIEGDKVKAFREKSQQDADWINGGFMVIEPTALSAIVGDVMFEGEPLEAIAKAGLLYCYKHTGKWQCMDTLRDKQKLEAEYETGHPFWEMNGTREEL